MFWTFRTDSCFWIEGGLGAVGRDELLKDPCLWLKTGFGAAKAGFCSGTAKAWAGAKLLADSALAIKAGFGAAAATGCDNARADWASLIKDGLSGAGTAATGCDALLAGLDCRE